MGNKKKKMDFARKSVFVQASMQDGELAYKIFDAVLILVYKYEDIHFNVPMRKYVLP